MTGHRFHFAKTMARIPHSYTRRREWVAEGDPPGEMFDGCIEDLDFVWACQFILDHGYQQRFFQRVYTYYDLGDHQYWNTGDIPEKEEIINRAERKGATLEP